MIRINRGEAPAAFQSERVMKIRREAEQFFSEPHKQRAQRSFDFQRVAANLYPSVRHALMGRFPAKCAYCETALEKPEIENFRPKLRAANLDGKIDEDCYWWLTFEWSNYLPACRLCNILKGSRFPILGQRAKAGTIGSELAAEDRLLLDPCEDDPSNVLLFLEDGQVTSDDERGRVSIDVLGLNREALVTARHRDLTLILQLLDVGGLTRRTMEKYVDTLIDMTSDSSPFAAMRRQFVRAWAMEESRSSPKLNRLMQHLQQYSTALDTGLKASKAAMEVASQDLSSRTQDAESYSVEADNVSDKFYRQARFIERFELTNIRSFDHLDLKVPIGTGEKGEWFVLLGENGTGKSSVLQALACALIGQAGVERLGIKASSLLRRGCPKGEVRVHVTGMSKPIVMTLVRRGERVTIDPPDPRIMVLAYGATRLLTPGKIGAARTSRINVANLFDPYARLSNGRPWLYEAGKLEFDRAARSLSALLPRPDGAQFSRRSGQIYVQAPGVSDTLDALSSGYQAVLALALDIMSVMRLSWEDMQSAEGIVLIDEVDAHLHPRWKMRIVNRLREVFPRLQFIATSHEPLTLRGLEREEVAVLRRSLDGDVTAVTSETEDFPSPKYMRVDQLLASELFGLYSSEDLRVDALFEEYYKLLAKQELTKKEEGRLAVLKRELGSNKQMGLTKRERLVFEAADSYIAQSRAAQDALPEQTLEDAKNLLKKLWADVRDSDGTGARTP